MTEKDYRKLVTDLELTKEDKANIEQFTTELFNLLTSSVRYFKINAIVKCGSLATNTLSHNDFKLDLMLKVDEVMNNSYPLMNKAVLNELYNVLLFNYKIEKKKDIAILDDINGIYINTGIYKVYLHVRYVKELEYQTEFFESIDQKRVEFINLCQSDFKLFKNTLQIIKYYKDQNDLKISNYAIELLLYYGLCENFTTHTYEAYLKEFMHAIDDFLKGMKIDQDDDTYRRLNQTRSQIAKKQYTIVDIASPQVNVTSQITEVELADLRKIKKIIAKELA